MAGVELAKRLGASEVVEAQVFFVEKDIFLPTPTPPRAQVSCGRGELPKERIFTELMTPDRKVQAGEKCVLTLAYTLQDGGGGACQAAGRERGGGGVLQGERPPRHEAGAVNLVWKGF